MNLPSISLEFREGSSDKVYKAAVEASGPGFVVNFAFGRRGSTLNTGSKTTSPVSLAEATSIYDKLVKSKTDKGYKPTGEGNTGGGIGSSVTESVANAVSDRDQRDTGLRPQLLIPIDEDDIQEYVLNDQWCGQEKFDGKRLIFRKAAEGIVAANRKGLTVGFPDSMAAGLAQSEGDFVVDGEGVGDVLYLFDILEHEGVDLRGEPYSHRLGLLHSVIKAGKSVVVAQTAFETDEKQVMLARLKAAGKEGMVFKRVDAKWSAGRPASGGPALKCKFWHSCSCVVLKANAKRSVVVALDGQPVGNVTIPQNHEIPKIGQVVEVKYLYVVAKGGSLYQPIYLGPRDDVSVSECTVAAQRLKYKAEAEDEAA